MHIERNVDGVKLYAWRKAWELPVGSGDDVEITARCKGTVFLTSCNTRLGYFSVTEVSKDEGVKELLFAQGEDTWELVPDWEKISLKELHERLYQLGAV